MDTQHDDLLNSLATESVTGHSEPLADLRILEDLGRGSRAKTSVEVPVELPIITAGFMRRLS